MYISHRLLEGDLIEPIVDVRIVDTPIGADLMAPEGGIYGAFGGQVTFTGLVRRRNDGKSVVGIEYECYQALAKTECRKICFAVAKKYGVGWIDVAHRIGSLQVGDIAVFIQVMSEHRKEAFAACSDVIDQIKKTVPIWKKEFYVDGSYAWPHCSGCSDAGLRQ